MKSRALKIICYSAFILYTVSLLLVEIFYPPEFVRAIYSEIYGRITFYALNTTISAFFLWATALMFFLCLYVHSKSRRKNKTLFYISQSVFFLYLGIDERFALHEHWVMERIYIFLIFGLAEIIFIVFLGRLSTFTKRAISYLGIAVLLFAIMLSFDYVLPANLPYFNLSLEELTKTWSNLFFFLFSWQFFDQEVDLYLIYGKSRSI